MKVVITIEVDEDRGDIEPLFDDIAALVHGPHEHLEASLSAQRPVVVNRRSA